MLSDELPLDSHDTKKPPSVSAVTWLHWNPKEPTADVLSTRISDPTLPTEEAKNGHATPKHAML